MKHLRNFHAFGDRIGTSGQPTPEQFRDIADAGYTTVVNLALHDSDDAVPEEGSLVAGLGMSYVHLPVPFDAPDAAHLRKFVRLMDALEDEKVFVHCVVNARVSAFMYKYLTLTQGSSPQDATSPLLEQWSPTMEAVWKDFMALDDDALES